MGTKVIIKSGSSAAGVPAFRLYEDVLDSFGSDDTPVYLTLDGVQVELHTLDTGGATMTVTLPRQFARTLGLIP